MPRLMSATQPHVGTALEEEAAARRRDSMCRKRVGQLPVAAPFGQAMTQQQNSPGFTNYAFPFALLQPSERKHSHGPS